MYKDNILVIEREPAPYKVDLWNAFDGDKLINPHILYMQSKNWLPDGGHDYQMLPKAKYDYKIFSGKKFVDKIYGLWVILISVIKLRPKLIYICGYSFLNSIYTILIAIVFKIKFVIFVDSFNNKPLIGRFAYIFQLFRSLLRFIAFGYADKILVCGVGGYHSAIAAGCPENKIIDFPYVVDKERILSDSPSFIPNICIGDLENKLIILFSGRLIERKGLTNLMRTFSEIVNDESNIVLWVEGQGPDIDKYLKLAHTLDIYDKTRFLGFCQFDLHSWLLRNSSIIVVPSIQDNWGIVVDEAISIGKIVISTTGTGSAIDRIVNDINGYLYSEPYQLKQLLEKIINGDYLKNFYERDMKIISKSVCPQHNIEILKKILLEA